MHRPNYAQWAIHYYLWNSYFLQYNFFICSLLTNNFYKNWLINDKKNCVHILFAYSYYLFLIYTSVSKCISVIYSHLLKYEIDLPWLAGTPKCSKYLHFKYNIIINSLCGFTSWFHYSQIYIRIRTEFSDVNNLLLVLSHPLVWAAITTGTDMWFYQDQACICDANEADINICYYTHQIPLLSVHGTNVHGCVNNTDSRLSY